MNVSIRPLYDLGGVQITCLLDCETDRRGPGDRSHGHDHVGHLYGGSSHRGYRDEGMENVHRGVENGEVLHVRDPALYQSARKRTEECVPTKNL